MTNFQFSIDGNVLTIKVNLDEDHGPSKSGRSRVISSSGGNLRLFDVNGYRNERVNFTVTKQASSD